MSTQTTMTSNPEPWRLDLDSHILFSPLRRNELSTNRFTMSSYVHEKAHWIRWQGSSIGLLLTLVRRARAIIALRAFGRLSHERRTKLRESSAYRAIWTFETAYEPDFISPDFALDGQAWLDLHYLEGRLLDGPRIAPPSWPGVASLAPALSNAWRAAQSFPDLLPHPDDSHADHMFDEPGALLNDVDASYEETLTTRAIWECACIFDELALSRSYGTGDAEEHQRLMLAKLDSQRNRPALQVAAQATGGVVNPSLFQVVTWIATDPPLPFIKPLSNPLSWNQVSPAHRFVQLHKTIEENTRFQSLPSAQALEEFAEDLAKEAHVPRLSWPATATGEPVEIVVGMGERLRQVIPSVPDFGSEPGAGQPIVASLNMLVRASLSLRATMAEAVEILAFPAPGLIVVGDKTNASDVTKGTIVATLLDPLAQDFVDDLYQCIAGGDYIVSRENLSSYIASVYMCARVNSLVTGRPLRTEGLPRKFRGITHEAPLDDFLEDWAGREISW